MVSVVEDFGDSLDSGCCGYCGGSKQSSGSSAGAHEAAVSATRAGQRRLRGALWAHRLRPEDYRLLMEHGWRRSGCFLYVPDNKHGCCPQYPVRIPTEGFEPTRSQRRVLTRWSAFAFAQGQLAEQCFLSYNIEGKKFTDAATSGSLAPLQVRKRKQAETSSIDVRLEFLRALLEPSLRRVPRKCQTASRGAHFTTPLAWRLAHEHKTLVADEANELAALLWRRGAEQVGISRIDVCNGYVNLYDSLASSDKETEAKRPGPPPCVATGEPAKHRKPVLWMELLRAEYRENAFLLYCKYQRKIHGDAERELCPGRYSRFLVDHPFTGEGESSPYGAFHLHIYLDNELAIVSVLDILPGCLSSKYCFYDPDLPPRLSAGIFAALCEIRFAHEVLGAHHYYLGYYIHSCRKMQYKVAFRGSQLLCGHCFQWRLFVEHARPALDRDEHCVGFCTEPAPAAARSATQKPSLNKVLVWLLDAYGCSAALSPQSLESVEPIELQLRVHRRLERLVSMVPSALFEHMIYLPPRSVLV